MHTRSDVDALDHDFRAGFLRCNSLQKLPNMSQAQGVGSCLSSKAPVICCCSLRCQTKSQGAHAREYASTGLGQSSSCLAVQYNIHERSYMKVGLLIYTLSLALIRRLSNGTMLFIAVGLPSTGNNLLIIITKDQDQYPCAGCHRLRGRWSPLDLSAPFTIAFSFALSSIPFHC